MKILFLAPANSVHSYRWVKFSAQKGHEIVWVSYGPSNFEALPNTKFIDITQTGKLGLLKAIPVLRKIVKTEKADVMHVHSAGTYGFLGSFCGQPVSRTILTAWGSDIVESGQHPIKGIFVKRALNKAGLITCDAFHMKDRMVKLGTPAEKIRVIFFGVDSQRFKPCGKSDEVKEKLGVKGHPSVISVRNFEPVYDIETLIKSVPTVLKRVPNVKFVIVGRGTLGDSLKALSKSMGLDSAINFVGFVPNVELPQYLSSMDVYVSTALSDGGIASSTAEAMACGVPVVTTKAAENGYWIKDGENGYLVEVSKPELLGNRIADLLENEALRKEFSEKGRATILERNDYTTEMEKMDRIYTMMGRGEVPSPSLSAVLNPAH